MLRRSIALAEANLNGARHGQDELSQSPQVAQVVYDGNIIVPRPQRIVSTEVLLRDSDDGWSKKEDDEYQDNDHLGNSYPSSYLSSPRSTLVLEGESEDECQLEWEGMQTPVDITFTSPPSRVGNPLVMDLRFLRTDDIEALRKEIERNFNSSRDYKVREGSQPVLVPSDRKPTRSERPFLGRYSCSC